MKICPNCEHKGTERVCPHDGFLMIAETLRSASKTKTPDLIGNVFEERYEVTDLLGRGGMGWVFKARHLTMHNDVALKVLRRELGGDLKAVKRFYQEARSCSQLKHPHTIIVHDFGSSEEGYLYLAMEFLDGVTLRKEMRKGRMGPLRAIRIARQICQSLDEAHELGMVHRDLKPPNIFLCKIHRRQDFVKVLDFGISKFVDAAEEDDERESLTLSGLVVGTPKYMSPEQARGQPVDRRADLYSLGVLLYEMLAGGVPFDASSSSDLLVMHVKEPPPPLPTRVGDVLIPPMLLDLVQRLLAKHPFERPVSAARVEERLARIERSLCEETPSVVSASLPHTASAVDETTTSDDSVAGRIDPESSAAALLVDDTTSDTIIDAQPRFSEVDAKSAHPSAPSLKAPRRWLWIGGGGLAAAVGAFLLLLAVGTDGTSSAVEDSGTVALAGGPPAVAGDIAEASDVATSDMAGHAVAEISEGTRPSPVSADDAAVVAPTSLDVIMATTDDAGANDTDTAVQVVHVMSKPAGVSVLDGDEELGVTPVDVEVRPGHERILSLRHEGFQDASATVNEGSPREMTVTLEAVGKVPGSEVAKGSGGSGKTGTRKKPPKKRPKKPPKYDIKYY